jgi:hypothetical protein
MKRQLTRCDRFLAAEHISCTIQGFTAGERTSQKVLPTFSISRFFLVKICLVDSPA